MLGRVSNKFIHSLDGAHKHWSLEEMHVTLVAKGCKGRWPSGGEADIEWDAVQDTERF